MNLLRIPAICLFLPAYAAGLLVPPLPVHPEKILLLVLCGTCLLYIGLTGFRLIRPLQQRWISGLFLCLLFFSYGAVRKQDAVILSGNSGVVATRELNDKEVLIRVSTYSFKTRKGCKYEGKVIAILNDSTAVKRACNIFLYFGDSLTPELTPGDRIICKGYFQALEEVPPGLRKYYESKGVQFILHSPEIRKIYKGNAGSLSEVCMGSNETLTGMIRARVGDDEAFAIVSALVLGNREHLDNDIRTAYANTGIIHILAVSGLHIGMVYLFISWILNLVLPFPPRLEWVKKLVAIPLIWIYSLITGFPPSVARAAWMFSCLAAGSVLKKKANVYSSLSFSAIMILNHDPGLIYDAGFLLSFFAVLSILTVQPTFNMIFKSGNRLLNYAWSMFSMSISSQVLTFPFLILFFQQFSIISPVANVLAVPVSGLILQGGVLLLMLFPVEPVSAAIGKILEFAVAGLNSAVLGLNDLPMAKVDGIYIDYIQFICLMIMAVGLSSWFYSHSRYSVCLMLAGAIALIAIHSIGNLATPGKSLEVHPVPGGSVISISENGNRFVLTDSVFPPEQIYFHTGIRVSGENIIQLASGADTILEEVNTILTGNVVWVNGMRLNVVKEPDVHSFRITKGSHPDVLVIKGAPPWFLLDELPSLGRCLVVFDRSVPAGLARYFTRRLREAGMNAVNLYDSDRLILRKISANEPG